VRVVLRMRVTLRRYKALTPALSRRNREREWQLRRTVALMNRGEPADELADMAHLPDAFQLHGSNLFLRRAKFFCRLRRSGLRHAATST